MHYTTADLIANRQQIVGILANLQLLLQAFPSFETDPALPPNGFYLWLEDMGRFARKPVYLAEQKSREFYRQGRIRDADLNAAIQFYVGLNTGQAIDGTARENLYRNILLDGLPSAEPDFRHQQHPERRELGQEPSHGLALTPPIAADESPSANQTPLPNSHAVMRKQAELEFDEILSKLGTNHSLRDFVLALSGYDVLHDVRPQLLRIMSSALDQGVAAWHLPDAGQASLYQAWRTTVQADASLFLHQLPDWQEIIAELPEQAEECIGLQLMKTGIPTSHWESYLRILLFDLPGCSRVVAAQAAQPQGKKVALADYLAIRLVFDRLWLNQACHDLWQVEAKLSALTAYFQKNLSEFFVRKYLYQGLLPEHLATLAEALIVRAGSERQCRSDWQQLADLLYGWRIDPHSAGNPPHSCTDDGGCRPEFFGHPGFNGQTAQQLEQRELAAMLKGAKSFDAEVRGQIWLSALEHRYRHHLFEALQTSHKQTSPAIHPTAQFIFCLDNREERLRRHLESLEPTVETFGTWGFCKAPSTLTPDDAPRHEQPHPASLAWLFGHPLIRQNMLGSFFAINLLAPLALPAMIVKALWPKTKSRWLAKWQKPDTEPASSPAPNFGLTDAKQTDWVADFLLDIGLTSGFADLIVLVAHGRSNENDNPSVCHACHDRNLGIRADSLAATLNRPAIRQALAERGIDIPPDTRFIATEQDGNDLIHWQLSPHPVDNSRLQQLQSLLRQALNLGSEERYRQTGQSLIPNHANHAALVIARRQLTRCLALDGRVFLQSYDPCQDPNGNRLENILNAMLARLVNLNLTYYLASVDNGFFGSGNETRHNPVGLFAALAGTDGDYRTGLSSQQVARHEPVRLSVVIEASVTVIAHVLEQNENLVRWFDGRWAYLSAIDPIRGEISHYRPRAGFQLSEADIFL